MYDDDEDEPPQSMGNLSMIVFGDQPRKQLICFNILPIV